MKRRDEHTHTHTHRVGPRRLFSTLLMSQSASEFFAFYQIGRPESASVASVATAAGAGRSGGLGHRAPASLLLRKRRHISGNFSRERKTCLCSLSIDRGSPGMTRAACFKGVSVVAMAGTSVHMWKKCLISFSFYPVKTRFPQNLRDSLRSVVCFVVISASVFLQL